MATTTYFPHRVTASWLIFLVSVREVEGLCRYIQWQAVASPAEQWWCRQRASVHHLPHPVQSRRRDTQTLQYSLARAGSFYSPKPLFHTLFTRKHLFLHNIVDFSPFPLHPQILKSASNYFPSLLVIYWGFFGTLFDNSVQNDYFIVRFQKL